MIVISELKKKAKATLSTAYWKCVLVAFCMVLVSGGGSGTGVNPNNPVLTDNDFGTFFGGSDSHGSAGRDSDEFFDGFEESLGEDLEEAKNAFSLMAGSIFGIFLVIFLVIAIVSIAITVFLLFPLQVGCRKFFMNASRGRFELGDMGAAFNKSYMNIVKTMFLKDLYTFFWSLLFIVPGIIKSYEYRMIPYILAENPDIDTREAFAQSKAMMTGDKLNAFVLDLSFIGWILLTLCTCGIVGIFYVNPYYYNTDAEMYNVLLTKIGITPMYMGGQDSSSAKQDPFASSRPFDRPYNQPYGQPGAGPSSPNQPCYRTPGGQTYQQPGQPTYGQPAPSSYGQTYQQPGAPQPPAYPQPGQTYQQPGAPVPPAYPQPGQTYQQPEQAPQAPNFEPQSAPSYPGEPSPSGNQDSAGTPDSPFSIPYGQNTSGKSDIDNPDR